MNQPTGPRRIGVLTRYPGLPPAMTRQRATANGSKSDPSTLGREAARGRAVRSARSRSSCSASVVARVLLRAKSFAGRPLPEGAVVPTTFVRGMLCARLLAADGPKLGQGRRPGVGIGAQDERLAAELHRAQSAGAYLLICRLTADPVGITKVFERQSRRIHF